MASSNPDALVNLPDSLYEGTLDCVHCGLCLMHCPTYRVTGRESSSPRGRIYMMRGVAEGDLRLDQTIADELHLCLGCRACETACPSGVEYGALLEAGRAAASKAGLRKGLRHGLEGFALRHVLPARRRLSALTTLLGWAQRLKLDAWLSGAWPSGLRRAWRLLPAVPLRADRRPLPQFTPAEGPRRGCVALHEGCLMPELFGAVNRATVRVLARNGYDVVVPNGQGCCGALLAHAGDLESARSLARENVRAFTADDSIDVVLSNSAGCGAALRETHHWLPEEGAALSSRVRDVCEWLDEVGIRAPLGRLPLRVAYDDPCHLVHAQRVAVAPRRLLEKIPGLELLQHGDAEACCGAAGTYGLLQPKMSAPILEAKMQSLVEVEPEVVATGNPGCLLQIRSGAEERDLSFRVLHPIELIDASHQAHS
ncbi:(Fe-S)-binding protein [Myxococcota bacterium]|nr:(Fe-S)-binding protein [Myxococcota bacterium]